MVVVGGLRETPGRRLESRVGDVGGDEGRKGCGGKVFVEGVVKVERLAGRQAVLDEGERRVFVLENVFSRVVQYADHSGSLVAICRCVRE